MQNLELCEIEQIGGGDFGDCALPGTPDYEDPNLQRFIEWKMMNPGYPYDQI